MGFAEEQQRARDAITEMGTEHGKVVTFSAAQVEKLNNAELVIADQFKTIQEQKDRIEELEAQLENPETPPDGGGGSIPPPPPPAILDERFTDGVDWTKYFSDSGGGPSAPAERFQVIEGEPGLLVTWIEDNPRDTMRSELGIRRDPWTPEPGSGDPVYKPTTPRRDPIESERWYLYEFMLPPNYVLDDGTADQKRVLWQAHQPGGPNPPLSLELRNGTFRLVRSVNVNGTQHRENLLVVPAVKGAVIRLLVHVFWSPTAARGWIEAELHTASLPKISKITCNTGTTEGMNIKAGSYQPGASTEGSYPNGYTLRHVILRWAIGDASNKYEDFQ